jgi:hypothetical protein
MMSDATDLLCRSWQYAVEESSPGVTVCYVEGYPLPASRGRTGIVFQADGTCVKSEIAPACGFDYIQGTWQWQPPGHLRLDFPKLSARCEFKVISLTEQRLCIQGKLWI